MRAAPQPAAATDEAPPASGAGSAAPKAMHDRYGDQRAKLFGSRFGRTTGSPPGGGKGASRDEINAQHLTREAMERQNDAHIDDLEAKVSALKNITRDISKEVKESTGFLDTMSQSFDKAGVLMKKTLGHLGVMMKSRGGSNLCLVAGFTVVMLFLLCSMRWLFSGSSSGDVSVAKVALAQNSTVAVSALRSAASNAAAPGAGAGGVGAGR